MSRMFKFGDNGDGDTYGNDGNYQNNVDIDSDI